MTPERRQQLMDQAAKEMRSRWGEVQPDALQALADELRTGIIENGALSVGDIFSEVTNGPHSQGCVSAWNKNPVGGVIGVQTGPL
jgi:hypothetical protein